MNCGDFRYLIQRRFDVELSPADDRALLIHLETCDSCQKFYHQVQQVIIAAEELELSEDVLPNNPEQLLNSVLENIPSEKPGIKALVLSFLSRLGLTRTNNGGLGTSDVSSSVSDSAILRRLPGSTGSASSESRVQTAEPTSHPITDWGRPAQTAHNFPISGETKSPITHSPPRMPEERVVTRSLSEKFGVSGAANILTNTPPLTLAESIRQKISEMSKTGGDYASGPQSVELPGDEPADEWSVPHSPEWPKLKIDASPEQWTNEPSGAKAPNVWGSPDAGWGSQSEETAMPVNQIPDYVVRDKAEPSVNKNSGWSAEAEQMETGTWQAVQFDTTLGAGASSYSSAALSLPNQSTSAPAQSNYVPETIGEQAEAQKEIPLPAPQIESVASTSNAVQRFMPSGSSGPKIYPVVSRRARSSASMTSLNAISSTSDQSFSVLPESSTRPEKSDSEALLVEPAHAPIDFTIAKEPKTRLPFMAHSQSMQEVSEPIASSYESTADSLPSDIDNSTSSTEIEKPEAKIEEDSSHLFQFDDGAIDKLFSNNLGVHERSVSAQAARSSGMSGSAPQGTAPSVLPESSMAPSSKMPPLAKSSGKQASIEPTIRPAEFSPPIDTPASIATPPASMLTEAAPSAPLPVAPAATDDSQTKSSGLFVVDDNMIDRIFTDHLGVPEQVSKNAVERQVHQRPSLELEIEKQKDSLAPAQPAANKPEPPPAADIPIILPTPELSKTGPQFGSAAGQSSGKQKVSGVGKLDSRVEPTVDTGSGRIASIGKFLLDSKDLEKIGKITSSNLSEGKLRTLTLEANDELKSLLKQVDAQQGVLGTLIVGHDGLLIAHTMSQDADAETLGVEALAVYMGTVQVVEKLGDDNVRQIVSLTNQGYLVVANFGAGLLVTLTNPMTLDYLLPLMRTITQLVAS